MNQVDEFVETVRPTYDDDSVDRLHYFWTCVMTFCFATTIGVYQFRGKPVQCWTPKEFPKSWESYIEDYCFVENVYWWDHYTHKPYTELQYYPWIPLILGLQGTMFFLPHFIWMCMNWQSGINIRAIIHKMKIAQNRLRNAKAIAEHIEQTLDLEHRLRGRAGMVAFVMRCGASHGFYLTLLYLFTKLLFLGNVVAQFFALNYFLGVQWTEWWGLHFVRTLRLGAPRDRHLMPADPFDVWRGLFPRIIMCSVDIRELGNTNPWPLQCVLWINMLNELVFLFLWWWYVALGAVTALNCLYWFVVCLLPSSRERFVFKYLRGRRLAREGDALVHKFVAKKLRSDGCFVLRLIANNVGELLTTDIVEEIFRNYAVTQQGGRRHAHSAAASV